MNTLTDLLLGVGQPRVSHFPDLCTLLYTYLSTLDYWTKIVYYLFTQTSPVAHTSALTPTYIKSQKLPNWPISKELGLGRMLLPHWKLLFYHAMFTFFQNWDHDWQIFSILNTVDSDTRYSSFPGINSSPPSATYMSVNWVIIGSGNALSPVQRQAITWTKFNQCCLIVNWAPGNKYLWNLNRNSIIFIQENAFQNVICQNGSHFVQGEMSELSDKFSFWYIC